MIELASKTANRRIARSLLKLTLYKRFRLLRELAFS